PSSLRGPPSSLSSPLFPYTTLFRSALIVFALLGKEFLPELDEGDLWLRVKFPIGISLEGAQPYVHRIRERLLTFPEVRVVVSQLDRKSTRLNSSHGSISYAVFCLKK